MAGQMHGDLLGILDLLPKAGGRVFFVERRKDISLGLRKVIFGSLDIEGKVARTNRLMSKNKYSALVGD